MSSRAAASFNWRWCAGTHPGTWLEVKRSVVQREIRGQDSPAMQILQKWHHLAPEQSLSLPRSLHCNPNGNYRAWEQGDEGNAGLEEAATQNGRVRPDFQTYRVEGCDYYPLLGTGEVHLECRVQFGAPQYEKHGRTGVKGHQDVGAGVYVPIRRLRELGLFNVEEKRLRDISWLPIAAK